MEGISTGMYHRLLIMLVLICGATQISYAQSPGANGSLQAPFEPITRISLGLERGIGYGGIDNYNFNGFRSIVDLVSYKFDLAVGVTQSEIGKNSFSINTIVTKNLDTDNPDKVEQFAVFTGFGYTKLYFDETSNNEQLNIPLGFCLGLDGPLPTVDINLCLSFRAQYRMSKFQATEHAVGIGINVGGIFFPSGKNVGLRINYDLLNINNKEQSTRITESGLSIGIQYIIY
jgi:hypothetical protein